MKDILNTNASKIALISLSIFAVLVWSYASQGYESDSNYLVIAGLSLVALDSVVLWTLRTTKKSVKKLNKVTTRKKAKK